jgi:lysozyme
MLGQMKLHPRVTRTGVELVKRFEGLRRRAARLPGGGWTIGYGHTLTAREGAEVSPEDAEALLYYDLSEVAGKLEAWTFTPLNQNQFEALSAFAFNIGLENFRNSTVLKRVNEGQHLQAGAAMELWRKADFNGEDLVVDALVRRRAAEKAHFLTPPEGFRPAPSPVLRPTFDHSVIEAAAQAQAARHATVVDVPLEGDAAIALVQQPSEAAVSAAALSAAPSPVAASVPAQPAELEAPEREAEAAPAPAEQTSDLGGRALPAALAPLAAGVATAATFRGFEPPPRRFEREEVRPAAAPQMADAGLEAFAAAPTMAAPVDTAPLAAPSSSTAWLHEQPGPLREGNLFEQPLAPPPPAQPLAGIRSMRLAADGEPEPEATPSTRPAFANGAEPFQTPGFLRNRIFLYASIGVLGVFLFSIAVGNMAFGKASSATVGTLLTGILGIVLMTPVGVWFLMRGLNRPTETAHD